MKVVMNKYLEELGINKNNYWIYDKENQDDARYHENEMGIIEAETWNMNDTLSMIIYSYLRYFKDHCWYSYPADLTEEKWEEIYNHILKAFELMLKKDEFDPLLCSTEEYKRKLKARDKKIKYGLKLFIKYYYDLWW